MNTRAENVLKRTLIATLLATSPVFAHAANVDSVTALPAAALIKKDVFFDIKLSGVDNRCRVRVSWGDGGGIPVADIRLSDPVSLRYSHQYTMPGLYTMSVIALEGCTGQANAQVRIDPAPVIGTAAPKAPPTPPAALRGRLAGLALTTTGFSPAPNTFRIGEALQATAQGVNGAACGLLLTSTATIVQPAGFVVDAAHPFPIARTFSSLKQGNHTVTATPSATANVPACDGIPVTVNIKVQ